MNKLLSILVLLLSIPTSAWGSGLVLTVEGKLPFSRQELTVHVTSRLPPGTVGAAKVTGLGDGWVLITVDTHRRLARTVGVSPKEDARMVALLVVDLLGAFEHPMPSRSPTPRVAGGAESAQAASGQSPPASAKKAGAATLQGSKPAAKQDEKKKKPAAAKVAAGMASPVGGGWGELVIRSPNVYGQAWINGRAVGLVPVRIRQVRAGSVAVDLRVDGVVRRTSEVEVLVGRRTLLVLVSPTRAIAYVGGKARRVTFRPGASRIGTRPAVVRRGKITQGERRDRSLAVVSVVAMRDGDRGEPAFGGLVHMRHRLDTPQWLSLWGAVALIRRAENEERSVPTRLGVGFHSGPFSLDVGALLDAFWTPQDDVAALNAGLTAALVINVWLSAKVGIYGEVGLDIFPEIHVFRHGVGGDVVHATQHTVPRIGLGFEVAL